MKEGRVKPVVMAHELGCEFACRIQEAVTSSTKTYPSINIMVPEPIDIP